MKTKLLIQPTRILALFLLLTGGLFWSCQAEKEMSQGTLTQFFKKYNGKEEVTSFSLPAGLVSMLVDENDKEAKEALKHIQQMKVFIHEDGQKHPAVAKDLQDALPSDRYNDLMIINEGGDKVTFKIQEKNNVVSELVIVVEDQKESLVVISIDGKIPLEDVKKLTKAIKLDDLKKGTKSFSLDIN